MLLKSVRLKNIRSYVDEEVGFPNGSVLLSGDIGSGKSTILLAVEFALFGLLTGELGGAGLLRNGAGSGSVELTLELDDRQYTIGRTLKRQKDSVKQDSGFVVSDGRMQEISAEEIKAFVLKMLGYPMEQLKKKTNPLYRFTVYTPQEEMKRILFEDADERVNTLRKIFDVDKYKRVRDNASEYARVLRERIRNFEGMTADLPRLKEELEAKRKEEFALRQDLELLARVTAQAKEALDKIQEEAFKREQAMKRIEDLKRKVAVLQAQAAYGKKDIEAKASEANSLKTQLADEEKTIAGYDAIAAEKNAADSAMKNTEASAADSEMQKTLENVAALRERKRKAEKEKNSFAEIRQCPVCRQEVGDEHRRLVESLYDSEIAQVSEALSQAESASERLKAKHAELKKDIEAIRQQEKHFLVLAEKLKSLDEKRKRALLLEQDVQLHLNSVKKIEAEIAVFQQEVSKAAELEAGYLRIKADAAKALEHFHELKLRQARVEEKLGSLQAEASRLDIGIAEKEKLCTRLNRLRQLEQWLSEHFIPLVEVIEKHVMARVYQEFNSLFEKWFSMLAGEEMMTARLDESFTPVINQNGYDVDVAHLSGGEKTACALAYRLALNKVINDVVSSIKTKDLLILDEPTDGFSEQQLDKVRDVLNAINARQVILVSHESRIENFVDHVMHVAKEAGVSRIVQAAA